MGLSSRSLDLGRKRARVPGCGATQTASATYYKGRIQLLLPLCIGNPHAADLALVVENHDKFYRAATCLTLDTAYNNARQLARPDRDWLQP